MSTIQELGAFLAREQAAGTTPAPTPTATTSANEPAGLPAAVDHGTNGPPSAGRD